MLQICLVLGMDQSWGLLQPSALGWVGDILLNIILLELLLGGVLFFLGLLGLVTSCSRSYSWSYCFSIILLVIIILQCLAGVLVVFFRSVFGNLFIFKILNV